MQAEEVKSHYAYDTQCDGIGPDPLSVHLTMGCLESIFWLRTCSADQVFVVFVRCMVST